MSILQLKLLVVTYVRIARTIQKLIYADRTGEVADVSIPGRNQFLQLRVAIRDIRLQASELSWRAVALAVRPMEPVDHTVRVLHVLERAPQRVHSNPLSRRVVADNESPDGIDAKTHEKSGKDIALLGYVF